MGGPVFRVVAACCALAGCNQIFGLKKTQPALFDAPADAPFTCPMLGQGLAPAFSDLFVQLIPEGTCENYTTSLPAANVAVATCMTAAEAQPTVTETGAIDAMALNVTPTVPFAADGKLSPEGDELWVGRTDPNANALLSVYTRSDTGWLLAFDAYTVMGLPYASPSTPMKKGTPRRTLYSANGEVHELDESAPGQWMDTGMTLTPQALGIAGIASVPQLSPDGLRIVFAGTGTGADAPSGVFYADRVDLSHPFGPAIRVTGPPAEAAYAFMTSDCSRMYFAGLGSILYVPQQ